MLYQIVQDSGGMTAPTIQNATGDLAVALCRACDIVTEGCSDLRREQLLRDVRRGLEYGGLRGVNRQLKPYAVRVRVARNRHATSNNRRTSQ